MSGQDTSAGEEIVDRFEPGAAPAGGTGVASLGTPKPKVRRALDTRKVLWIAGTLGLGLGFVILNAFAPRQSPSGTQPAGAAKHAKAPPAAIPSGEVNRLPKNYAQVAQQAQQLPSNVPALGKPIPGELGGVEHAAEIDAEAQAGSASVPPLAQGTAPLTPAEQQAINQIAQQARLARLKRAAQARDAGLSFGSLLGTAQAATPAAAGYPPPAPQPVPNVTGGLPGAPTADPNGQSSKAAFVKAGKKPINPYLDQPLIQPANHDVVQAGTIIPALFLTGINSDLPGLLTAQVSEPVYDSPTGRTLLIPQGTRLIGEYDSKITYGQDRVLLVWTRLIFPDGASIALQGMPGVDMSGYAGVKDQVDNHWGKIIGAVLLSSVLSTAVVESQGNSLNALSTSAGQLAAQGAAQGVNQAGDRIVQRQLSVQPTLIIRPGQRIAVMVDKDIQLPPYP